jgi:predicted DNA-binding transcriptional regulator AlpA
MLVGLSRGSVKPSWAVYLGRSTRWVEMRVRDGMPSRMIGGRRAFRRSDVDMWVDERFG